MKKSAILAIDVQKSFFESPYWRNDELPEFGRNLTRLVEGAMARNVPVVHVFHVEPEGHFAQASGLVTAMDCLPGTPAARFEKTAHNAFTTTGLGLWLAQRGINHLVIAGIRTEQCCETTARVAADLGYAVDFVTEATLTFPMVHAGSGRAYGTAELKERAELVLADRFARIVDVERCLEGLAA